MYKILVVSYTHSGGMSGGASTFMYELPTTFSSYGKAVDAQKALENRNTSSAYVKALIYPVG